ncbi:MAG: hypothetical protein CFE34_04560 [Rhodobacteraceae bacterium PARR1]|nr:MAG: hypothetical protein CFE34_04560 [Rhodobacteraceae bacterium PARR1]
MLGLPNHCATRISDGDLMKKALFCGLAALILAPVLPPPALAEAQSEVVFSHKHWTVEAVAFDDGSFGCVAQVSAPGDSFSLWVLQDQTVKLQFYSDDWQFEEGTADLMIAIDRRSPWTLNDADLYENSVLFTLGDDDAAFGFIKEVARGSRLYLMDDSGDGVKDYSLAGSSASISALGECGDVLSEDPSNPFK